jgi:hypothetical protein
MILSRERFLIKLEKLERESLGISMPSEKFYHKEVIQMKPMISKKG